MATLGGLRRPVTARLRMGLGVALSAGLHALALVFLMVVVTRDPPTSLDNVATDEVVTVGSIGDDTIGVPGLPTTPPPPGPAVERVARDPGAPAAALPGRPAPGPRAATVRTERRRVVTAAPQRPPSASPAAPPAATAPSARGRTVAQAPSAPATAPHPAQAPAAIDVGSAGQAVDPSGGAEQEGSPGSSQRAAFRSLLRKTLRAAWRPQEIYQRVDPGGQLKGSLLVTAVMVRLRADGSVERTQVAESSGVRALDDEAVGAIRRMKLPPLPREILDDSAGFDVRCSLFLDVGMFRFAREIHKAIAESWRPSQAYRASEAMERSTIVKLTLSRDGALNAVTMINSAGIDFLDRSAMEAVRPGTRLPPPPPAYASSPGGAFMFVKFDHHLGELQVLRPKERIDEY